MCNPLCNACYMESMGACISWNCLTVSLLQKWQVHHQDVQWFLPLSQEVLAGVCVCVGCCLPTVHRYCVLTPLIYTTIFIRHYFNVCNVSTGEEWAPAPEDYTELHQPRMWACLHFTVLYCTVDLSPCLLSCPAGSVVRALCLGSIVLEVRITAYNSSSWTFCLHLVSSWLMCSIWTV